jgi:K(+)-stimulated pyrophosphate-energized sodium pump
MVFGYSGQDSAEMLGGYMAGVAVSGVLWAIFQNNAGGAWDNAKKSFEAGVMIDGEMTFKGSEAHKASVTGDTVGDPFKDTSGPSMNILIKLTCLVGLVIAPILGGGHESHAAPTATEEVVEVRQEVMKMKLKDVAVRLDGAITGEATASMDVTVEDMAATISISFASEEFNGTFSSLEADTDGMNFDAHGMVSMNGEELGASTHFHLDKEGSISEFVILFE